jgi:hypothetical protein
MDKDIIEFVKENYRLDKTKQKITSSEIKVELILIKGQIQLSFPIMRDNKRESKLFNNMVKKDAVALINDYFNDVQGLISSKNFKLICFESEKIYKYCFFYKCKNLVFSIVHGNEKIDFLYLGKKIDLVDLKYVIFKYLFGIQLNDVLFNPYNDNKNLNQDDLNIIKILLL